MAGFWWKLVRRRLLGVNWLNLPGRSIYFYFLFLEHSQLGKFENVVKI